MKIVTDTRTIPAAQAAAGKMRCANCWKPARIDGPAFTLLLGPGAVRYVHQDRCPVQAQPAFVNEVAR